ncbi:MAG: hypothetical protein DRP49_07050 [Spirochaetes bacterium]|nr:MAG: hypothetical protein DRP49_07050 [Spirochaetota bacterium]
MPSAIRWIQFVFTLPKALRPFFRYDRRRLQRQAGNRRFPTSPIVLEGGFDSEGTFFYLLFWGLEKMTEFFRWRIFNLFLEKKLINESFARNMLS